MGVTLAPWLNTRLSKSRLAVVPGYSHYNFTHTSAGRRSRRVAGRVGEDAI